MSALVSQIPRTPHWPRHGAEPCPHCADKDERIAWLEDELGLRRRAGDRMRLIRAFGLRLQEAVVLQLLYSAKGRPLGRDAIDEATQEFATAARSSEPSSNLHKVYICRLRRKLGRDVIETADGLGYAVTPHGAALIAAALERPA